MSIKSRRMREDGGREGRREGGRAGRREVSSSRIFESSLKILKNPNDYDFFKE